MLDIENVTKAKEYRYHPSYSILDFNKRLCFHNILGGIYTLATKAFVSSVSQPVTRQRAALLGINEIDQQAGKSHQSIPLSFSHNIKIKMQ